MIFQQASDVSISDGIDVLRIQAEKVVVVFSF